MEKHFAASCFVRNRDGTKVLMVYHKKLDVWVIPGGHLEPNEFPHEGAAREVLEETGVKVNIWDECTAYYPKRDDDKETQIKLPLTMLAERIPAKGDKPEHVHMDFIFLGEADDSAPLKQQEDEVEAVKWMTKDEVLKSNTFESVKSLAILHLLPFRI